MSEYKIPRKITHGRKRRKRRIRKVWKMIFAGAALLVLLILILCLKACFSGSDDKKPANDPQAVTSIESQTAEEFTGEAGSEEGDESQVEGDAAALNADADSAAEPAAPETEVPETTAARLVGELPKIDINSWEYLLVNAEHTVDKTFAPDVVDFETVKIDKRILDPLTEFVAAARAEGLPVYMSSAYRDYGWQSSLFNKKLKQGYSYKKAATIVAPPGTSEHQTGLAADITDKKRKTKDKSLEKTETYKWMSAHCAEYGFIVRFPNDKSDITGIIYEPWHFRYVGKEVARFMTDNNLCLEEFVALYQTDKPADAENTADSAADGNAA